MKFRFWRKDTAKFETMSWNLMVAAIDPDFCWKLACMGRDTGLPGSVRTCEASFLMGSVARSIIREFIPEAYRRTCIVSAESAYFKTFDEQSEEPMPVEMASFYKGMTLGHASRIALAVYGEDQDELFLTTGTYVRRLSGDPRMKVEVQPLFEERRLMIAELFSRAIE